MNAIRLHTEYLLDPIGIDLQHPRLFWNCEGGVKQTACEIEAVSNGKAIWNSGKVESGSMRAVYSKEPFSRQQVSWKVRLWDENDQPGNWSEEAFFEMGLLEKTDWKAQWITGNYTVDKKQRYPVDCFRKSFTADSVDNARLYITACGLYEARLNGVRVGDFIMAPGYTDYKIRVQYQTYDVSALLRPGENVLEIILADGWYRGSTGAWGLKNQYGTETKLLAQLEVGGKLAAATDETWQWSNDGPIRFADNKDGEIFDARMSPGYSGHAKLTCHNVSPAASNNVPVLEHERLINPTLITTPGGKKVLDFGQNIAGTLEFNVQAKAGERIFLRLGEMLDERGEFTQKNIQCSNKKITTPLQQVEYFCKEGENHYKTTFAVFGFQYVLVETDAAWKPGDFTAIAVYSDMERTGWFESSNELLNKFVENTVWSAKNNFLDIPTDCPTRERHGWTGDAQIFFTSAAYLFACQPFMAKFVRDMVDEQKPNGCYRMISPNGGVDKYMYPMDGSVGWSDAGVMIPYRHWKMFGDRDILTKNYESMRKYALFMIRRAGKFSLLQKPIRLSGEAKKYLVNVGQSYGEWAEPSDIKSFSVPDFVFPHPEESTAYTSYVMGLMEEIARELGKPKDEALFAGYKKGCKLAYQALIKKKGFTLDTNRQAKLVRPLYFHLLDEADTEYAKKKLISVLDHYGWRLGTGFLSTPFILYVLMEYDLDAAYRLLENEEIPGWLAMSKLGANTIWEGWEGTKAQGSIASLNHYSKGAVCEWLFTSMCGIQVAGENHFIIAPRPGGHFTHAAAEYQSIYGMVKSSWKLENGKAVYTITVPANCTAQVRLPGGRIETVTTGGYTYEE